MLNIVIDTNNIIYRLYHAMKNHRDFVPDIANRNKLIDRSMEYIMKIINLERCDKRIVFCVDSDVDSWRVSAYSDYKIKRTEKSTFIKSVLNEFMFHVSSKMNCSVCINGHYEADDLMAVCCDYLKNIGHSVMIVSADSDSLQLVDGHLVVVYNPDPSKKGYYMDESIKEKTSHSIKNAVSMFNDGNYGFAEKHNSQPIHYINKHKTLCLKILCGDNSDCVTGIPHIGEVKANKIYNLFPNIQDYIYIKSPLVSIIKSLSKSWKINEVGVVENKISLNERLIRLHKDNIPDYEMVYEYISDKLENLKPFNK